MLRLIWGVFRVWIFWCRIRSNPLYVLQLCGFVSLLSLSSATRTVYENGYGVTLDDRVITAEVGLCVVTQCSYTVNMGFSPRGIIWSKCERSRCVDSDIMFNSASPNLSNGFNGRISLLEPDIYIKNCSIIINDLTVSDSGSYQLSIDGYLFGKPSRHAYSVRVKVIVRGMKSFHKWKSRGRPSHQQKQSFIRRRRWLPSRRDTARRWRSNPRLPDTTALRSPVWSATGTPCAQRRQSFWGWHVSVRVPGFPTSIFTFQRNF